MNLFFSSIINKSPQKSHQCPKTHICINKQCQHSYTLLCEKCIQQKHNQQQYSNSLKSCIDKQQFSTKLEYYKQSNKFQAKLVAFSITQVVQKLSEFNQLKIVISEKQNQILSRLAKIQQLFTKSISFQKTITQNIFISQTSKFVLQNIKQNLQYNLSTKSFVDTFTALINDQLIEHKSFVYQIQEETNISKSILEDIRKITKKMHHILSQKQTQQERQLSFSVQYEQLEPWESQQKSQSKTNNYLQKYIKAFKKQFEIRFQTFNKIKETVSNYKHSNSFIYQDISLYQESPTPSLLKRKMKILNNLSIQKQKQFPSQSNTLSTHFESRQQFQSPKVSKLQLIPNSKEFQEQFVRLQLQRNQFEQQLLKLKNNSNTKLNQHNEKITQKYQNLLNQVKELKQQIKKIKKDNQGIKQQINQQICNYVEEFYQDQKKKQSLNNNSNITTTFIVSQQNKLSQKQQNKVIEPMVMRKSFTFSEQFLQANKKKQMGQKSFSCIQNNQKQIKPERKESQRQSIQNLLYETQRKQKQNHNLVQRLKQLELIIQQKNKQILKLQKLKFQNTISKQFDDQLKINKSFYQNQVFLAKQENQNLQTKIKYFKNKIQNINSFQNQQNQRIFQAQSKGNYLQTQLNQTIWQKYILSDKNTALEKKIKHLERTLEKFKDQFYVLKDYTSKMEKSKREQIKNNSFKDQEEPQIDLEHFDIQESICQSPLRKPFKLKINPGFNILQQIAQKHHELEQSKQIDNMLDLQTGSITKSQLFVQLNQQQQATQRVSIPKFSQNNHKKLNDSPSQSFKLIDRIKKKIARKSSFGLQKVQNRLSSKQKINQRSNDERAVSQKNIKSKSNNKYLININQPFMKEGKLNRNQSHDNFSYQFRQQPSQNKGKELMFINQILKKQRKGDNLVTSYKIK